MNPETQEKLAALDQQIRSQVDEMHALLRESTDHSPLKEYTFDGPDGPVTLSSCFQGRDDLIVIHNMGSSCSYCTMWADGLNGVLHHLNSRSEVILVSPDSPESQAKFAQSRGWNMRMLSDPGEFTTDMGYRWEQDGKPMNMPGYSTFRRDGDEIHRVAHAPFGPGDLYSAPWHMFALLDAGVDGWQPKYTYG